MMIAVCKQVSVYQKEAPFLIAALYKKIYQELSLGRGTDLPTGKAKLTSKRFKYLQSLYFIIAHGSEAISKQLATSNIFSVLVDYITRYQWHSLALIEIEKIFKVAFYSNTEAIFIALNRCYLSDKLKELGRIQQG